MKSMAYTTEEMKEMQARYNDQSPETGEKYPYGLELHLDTATLKKLGINELPSVGESFMLQAKAVVDHVGADEQLNGDKNKRMCLQITAMSLGKEESDKRENQANKLYA